MKGKLILYGAPWCDPCKSAKAWLAAKKIKYVYQDVAEVENQDALAEIGVTSLPTAIYNGEIVTGFQKEEWEETFGHLSIPK